MWVKFGEQDFAENKLLPRPPSNVAFIQIICVFLSFFLLCVRLRLRCTRSSSTTSRNATPADDLAVQVEKEKELKQEMDSIMLEMSEI